VDLIGLGSDSSRWKWPWCGGLWKVVPMREDGEEVGGEL
jgi:hypothetical protein